MKRRRDWLLAHWKLLVVFFFEGLVILIAMARQDTITHFIGIALLGVAILWLTYRQSRGGFFTGLITYRYRLTFPLYGLSAYQRSSMGRRDWMREYDIEAEKIGRIRDYCYKRKIPFREVEDWRVSFWIEFLYEDDLYEANLAT